jgi:hypothetical protein
MLDHLGAVKNDNVGLVVDDWHEFTLRSFFKPDVFVWGVFSPFCWNLEAWLIFCKFVL